jgi:hypothetical protein
MTQGYHNNKRILLQGPSVITSSVLFDLAISIASNELCRCHIDGGSIGCCCENCNAVTVIRSSALHDQYDNVPLPCQPLHDHINDHSDSENGVPRSQSLRRRLDRTYIEPNGATGMQRRRDLALHRIQIYYATGIQDILHYLLTIASQPVQRLPLGGIFIDQLDEILMQQYKEYPEDIATIPLRMSQTGTASVGFIERLLFYRRFAYI